MQTEARLATTKIRSIVVFSINCINTMKQVIFWQQHQRWPNIRLVVEDITSLATDAIVTGVKPDFMLSGGVNSAINRVAGPELLAALTQIGQCPLGQAVITPGFRLKSKYVIHTACPMYQDREEVKQTLANCYQSSLTLASLNNCQSIAFPALATGMFGFPHRVSANVASRAIRNYIFENTQAESALKQVDFVVFQAENFDDYGMVFSEVFV